MISPPGGERFACIQCGQCCRVQGFVRLTDADVTRIADGMGMDVETFTARHTRLMPDRSGLALHEQENGACAQLSCEGRCRIQAVKPAQCRGFPHTWRYPDMDQICEGWKT